MTAGDKERVSELVAVDAVFGTVFGGGTWFSSKARDEFWALVDFFNALNVELVVGSCEQHAEGMFVRLTCEATQSDDFLGALGVEIDGSALLTVEAGLIDIFRAATGTPFDPNLPAYILTKRRGLSFPVEAENLYENFFDWAAASKPEIAEASCGAGLADRVTVECAAFMLDHVDEYVTESE